MSEKGIRIVIALLSLLSLLTFFLFQHIDFARILFQVDEEIDRFLINRTFRFFVNDSLTIMLIYALFNKRKYVLFAMWVQIFGFVFLLIPYFAFKIYWPSYNGPLINFLHRIVLNPLLMLLLIPAFYHQERSK